MITSPQLAQMRARTVPPIPSHRPEAMQLRTVWRLLGGTAHPRPRSHSARITQTLWRGQRWTLNVRVMWATQALTVVGVRLVLRVNTRILKAMPHARAVEVWHSTRPKQVILPTTVCARWATREQAVTRVRRANTRPQRDLRTVPPVTVTPLPPPRARRRVTVIVISVSLEMAIRRATLVGQERTRM